MGQASGNKMKEQELDSNWDFHTKNLLVRNGSLVRTLTSIRHGGVLKDGPEQMILNIGG